FFKITNFLFSFIYLVNYIALFFVILVLSTQKVVRDFVFLVDGSNYVGNANLPAVRDFISSIVNRLDVRPERVRIGLIQFAERPRTVFYLNTHSTKQDVLASIAQLQLIGGNVLRTGAALQFALANHFQDSAGSRGSQGVQQVLVLITGGQSQDEVKRVADQVALAGVLTFAVGAGQAAETELRTVAFVPNLAYYEQSFATLPTVVEQMMTPLITVVGEPCELLHNSVMLIIYFVHYISHNALTCCFFSFFKEVLTAIRGLSPAGGRSLNTGAALKFMKDTILSSAYGSRASQNVAQFLIVLTGGKSRDSVKEPARDLKTEGVVPFGVGVKNADPKQIEDISHNPSFAFTVKEFIHATVKAKDIVFLLDGSDDAKNGFSAIRNFVERVVEKLSLEEGKDRVSVVQYSDDSTVNFYLNTYLRKEDILNAIKVLKHKGGRGAKIGAALQFVRHQVFTSSSGSRRLQGVPQILILLSSSPSSDGMTGPAMALRDLEVVSMSIGVGNADPNQLNTVAFQPSFTHQVSSFDDLYEVEPRLVSSLKSVSTDLGTISTTEIPNTVDVVILLDGSDNTRDGFPLMCLFVQRMVDKLNIGDSRDRVSVVQYSTQAQVHFLLNTHFLKQDVFNSIKSLQHQGGSHLNIGAALDFIKNHVFITSSGSRYLEGVPQILILVTGGRSQDDVRGPAAALKQEKIVPFCVGTQTADIKLLHFFFTADSGKRDVVLLIDGSDNTRRSFSSVQKFVQLLAERLNIGNNRDQMSVVQYGDTATVDFFLNTHSSREEVTDSVKRLRHKGGRSLYIGAALQYVNDNVFTVLSGSRHLERVPQILVLLSTGRSRDDVRGPVKVLKEKGVISLSIGTTNADTLELQTVSHQPNNFFVANFEELSTISEDVLSFIKGVSIKQGPAYVSVLRSNVAFLVDGSDDSRNGFEAIRGFVQKVIENLKIEENGDRVALVQYSQDTTANFYLNSYSNKNDVMSSVRSVKHKGGRPQNSGSALRFIRDYIFTPSSGGRHQEGIPQILYMFCGDRSNDDIRGVSQALREKGIKIFTIGTTNAFAVQFMLMLSIILKYFEITVSLTKHCTIFFLVQTLTTKRDIVFLIDGSDDVRNHFTALREFLASLVNKLDIGHNKDQIAVVQFSNTAVTNFNLNTFTSADKVTNAVQNLRPQGGRPQYIGLALQFVKDNVLTPKNGSRESEGAKQIIVLLASGRSRDSPRGPASTLKNAGVAIFVIGSRLTDNIEMEAIASQTNYTYKVPDFYNLDIAFLVDGSDNTRRGFQALRDFLYNVIANLAVGVNNDRISVIQYSNVPVANFYLNSFSKKEDVLSAVKGLTHRGGRPLNTGSALRYVTNNIFVTSSGSRHTEGLPQILIMLTSGKSKDNTEEPANILKNNGVSIIGIGTQNSDSNEIKNISSEKESFSVADFTYLPNIQEQVEAAIKTISLRKKDEEEKTVQDIGKSRVQ
uniref:VWFA domain-containing protein n=1 Tax=Pygocentrus nattereri TaxID=42514 RepID=A0AAR2J3Z0_PYGNA